MFYGHFGKNSRQITTFLSFAFLKKSWIFWSKNIKIPSSNVKLVFRPAKIVGFKRRQFWAILSSFPGYDYMDVKMGSRISETTIFGPSKSIYSYPKDNLKTKHSHTMTKHHPSVLINVF